MANTNIYYNRAADFNPDEVADGDSVEAEFDSIQLGFKKVEETNTPIASPTFTGTPSAPTAVAGTNTTQLATTAFVANAIANILASALGNFVTDTGAANSYVVGLTPALTARSEGQVIRFKVANTNTGSSTINDGLGVVPLVGGAHAALQYGELVAGGDAWVQWNGTVGTGSYVLLFCTGAPLQVAAPTKAKHAVNLEQFAANLVSAGGYFKIPVFDARGSVIRTVIVQVGTATISFANTAVTVKAISFPIVFPTLCAFVKLSQNGGVSIGAGMNVSEAAITSTGFSAMTTTSGVGHTSIPFRYFSIGW